MWIMQSSMPCYRSKCFPKNFADHIGDGLYHLLIMVLNGTIWLTLMSFDLGKTNPPSPGEPKIFLKLLFFWKWDTMILHKFKLKWTLICCFSPVCFYMRFLGISHWTICHIYKDSAHLPPSRMGSNVSFLHFLMTKTMSVYFSRLSVFLLQPNRDGEGSSNLAHSFHFSLFCAIIIVSYWSTSKRSWLCRVGIGWTVTLCIL